MKDESRPPLRYAPTGTSALNRNRTAASMAEPSASAAASNGSATRSVARGVPPGSGNAIVQ
jgi:hypothetical protein